MSKAIDRARELFYPVRFKKVHDLRSVLKDLEHQWLNNVHYSTYQNKNTLKAIIFVWLGGPIFHISSVCSGSVLVSKPTICDIDNQLELGNTPDHSRAGFFTVCLPLHRLYYLNKCNWFFKRRKKSSKALHV